MLPQDEAANGESGVSNLNNSQATTTNTSNCLDRPTMFDFHDMPSPAPSEEEHDEQQQLTTTAELLWLTISCRTYLSVR